MNAFTPGPWVRFTNDGRTIGILPAGRFGDVVVFSSPPAEADAALIAAAPDLLAALERLEVASRAQVNGGTRIPAYLWPEARAAIAKARGDK